MHPQIREDHPGSCPICGMALVPLHSQEGTQSTNPVVVLAEAPAINLATNQQPQPEMSASAEAVIHLDEARSSVASLQTTPVENRIVHRKVELFGEIAYISDRHLDFTWYFGGRVQKVLIDYNTTEVSAGEPVMKVYSEEAIAEQRAYLETLRQRWLATFYERKNFDAQLTSIRDRLFQIGMTDADFKNLEKTGRVQSEFVIRDLALLKLGQQITIKCPAHPDESFRGKLVFIDREVDPQKRTIKARFLVPNPKRMLLPRLSATGILEMGGQMSLLAIPSSAVIDTGKRQLVYVETSPHTYELRPVSIGPEGEIPSEGSTRWVSVNKGLKAGERVVSSGAFLIDAEAQMQGLPASRGEASPVMPADHKP